MLYLDRLEQCIIMDMHLVLESYTYTASRLADLPIYTTYETDFHSPFQEHFTIINSARRNFAEGFWGLGKSFQSHNVRTSNLSDGQTANEVLILKPSSLVIKQEREFSMLAGHLLDLSPFCHQNSPFYAAKSI